MIQVFSKPDCSSCDAAKKFLSRRGVDFEEKEIDDKALAMASLLGINTAPIVVFRKYNESHVHGGYLPHILYGYAKKLTG